MRVTYLLCITFQLEKGRETAEEYIWWYSMKSAFSQCYGREFVMITNRQKVSPRVWKTFFLFAISYGCMNGVLHIRVFLLLHTISDRKGFSFSFSTSQVDEKIRENESSRNLFTLSAGELDAGYIFFFFLLFEWCDGYIYRARRQCIKKRGQKLAFFVVVCCCFE